MASADRRGAPPGSLTTSLASEDLAQLIGHAFARPELLAEALTHPSALPPRRPGRRRPRRVAPNGVPRGTPRGDYERLEFLGDRVLGLVIADLLWRGFEHEQEGPLTRRFTHLVRRDALARVAAAIGLDRHLQLSPAEAAAGAARNPGILADVLEAVIAAIYLDGGLSAAVAFIERFWEPLLAEMEAPPSDPKTTLQEWAQARGLPLPAYELIATSGPDHAPHFTVSVRVSGQEEASATASSKRAAETGAAAALLERLNNGSIAGDAKKE
jgi:ribonuclease-3